MFSSKSVRPLRFAFGRFGALLTLAVLAATAFYSTSSASLDRTAKSSNPSTKTVTQGASVVVASNKQSLWNPFGAFSPLFMPQAPPPPESIATYAADCTTAKTTFALGDTVCAVVSNAPVLSPAERSVTWQDPAGFVVQRTDLTSLPNDSLGLPMNPQSVVFGIVVDNVGAWRVNLVPASSSRVRAAAFFSVTDTTNPSADLNVYSSADTSAGDVPAGTNLSINTSLENFGPDTAANVVFTQAVPANATFVSNTQTGGPTFTCTDPAGGGTGTSSCTLASWPRGVRADFTFVYLISAVAPKGTLINSLAHVSSDTAPLHTEDDSSIATATVTDNPNAPTCAVGCPANITVSAASPSGTVVNFSADIESSGSCGTVTATPASGSLFAVGTTTVNVTSDQGASCSFTVTVTNTAAPTITCAADQTVAATGTDTETPVTVNAPTATGTNVTVTGVRSDNRNVSDPYPVGNTTITWTAKECFDTPDCLDPSARTASCTQHIIVTNPNAPTITCPSDKTFDAGGDCQKTLTAGDIGTPMAGGPGVTVDSERSDGLRLTLDPYPAGQTTITWTATNALGSVSCTQTITITASGDTTPPTLTIPADVSATTDTCSALLDDELGAASATDNCSSVNISRTGVPLTPFPGGPIACPTIADPGRRCIENFNFPVGTTDITYTATDASGNTATGVQHVTVHETTPPVFTSVPGPVTVNTGSGATSCGAFVGDATLGTATVSDNCDTTVIRSGVPAGNIFPVGHTTITYTAKADITVTATQIVTVVDNTPPVVTPPAAVTLFTGPGATSCGVTVSNLNGTLGTGSATDNCAVGAVTRSGVPAGNVFPVGQTTLTYSATDAHGNTSSANQIVTVVDNTPPTISCQANIIADFDPAVNGAVVTYTAPVGTDNCASNTVRTAGLASGSTFPTGTTTNTFKVTDASGNTASCSFKVTVALTSLIGLDSVTITGSGYADSYSSAGGYPATKSSLANVLSNGTITIGGSGKVWGNVRSTRVNVNMTGSAQVTGNATAGTTVTTSGSATVLGTRTNNALAPVMTLPAVPACSPFSSNSGISGTYTYSAGTGDLTLSGVNIATLANGNYCFHNITLGNSGQLKVNGPVVIKMTGTLNTSGATSLNNTTQIPSNLRILSSYSGSNGVILGNSTSVYALVYAPNTGLNLSGSAPLFGTFAGKTLIIGNSGAIHYDTQLKTVWPAVWTLILGP